MAQKRSPALNLASAAVAGAITLVRPTRFPRWARRGLSLANTAGTAGAVFFAIRGEDELPEDHPLHRALTVSDLTAATTGGLMLVTSGLGVKADAKIEQFLVRHGVRHPRVVMAVGVVTVLFIVKTVQDRASKHAPEPVAGTPKPPVSDKPANKTLPTTGSAGAAPTEQAAQPEAQEDPGQ
ncbi:hypothetical protein [Flexivirga oryzae]|uniref:Uncharacterized protein n=1 Tax=Flexivirga oryzae TaxID=1794944 RepID=A0A839NKB4_9MICO|nr:hypothetical protein [Flexivirga oryzae]MBB2894200.1 hypothetical protein [Flexivirga oryzae]MBB2894772.1 hypothetical protein [Flexivirga oryzae]